MSRPTIIPRELVAEKLAVTPGVLVRYESRGLVRSVREGSVEGYAPAEVGRIWTILSYQRDLGINLAGVETILRMRDHVAQVHERLDFLVRELREIAERQEEPRQTRGEEEERGRSTDVSSSSQ